MSKIYIVDDSKVIRERLKEMLAEISSVDTIGQTGDPMEALNDIRKYQPDAVILDIRLPGINGIELLKKIKAEQPSTIVIMLTDYPYRQYRQQSLQAGADYFFHKATQFKKVIDLLKSLNSHHVFDHNKN